MTKSDIYINIDSEEKRLKAIEILERFVEPINSQSRLWKKGETGTLIYVGKWVLSMNYTKSHEVSVYQLEEILKPNSTRLTIEEATQQYKDFMNEKGYQVEIVITEK